MENNIAPQTLAKPFAADGDKNTIPVAATGTNKASLTEGFPPITETPVNKGGIPPERKDFNGAMNLNSQFYFAFQNGWHPTFSEEVSAAIGGYAQDAVLCYFTNGTIRFLKSTKPNNTDNFNTNPSVIGTSWVDAYISQSDKEVTDLGTVTQTTSLDTNTNYTATLSGSAIFTLPTPSDTSIENTINILLNVSVNSTVDWGVNANSVLTSFTAGKYELRLRYNNSTSNWIGEVLEQKATPSHIKCFVSFNDTYTDETGNVTFTPNFTPEYSDIEGFTAYEGTKSLALPRNDTGRGFTISDPNNALTFTGPFTVKFWLRLNGSVDFNIFKGFDGNSSNAFRINQYATFIIGTTYFYPQNSVDLRSALHYIEVTRDSNNVIYLFVDGVLVPRSSSSQQGISGTIKLSDSTLCFCNEYDGRIYVQDFVSTDQVGHTANYDVPTAPYVISDNSLADLHDESLAAKIAELEAEINNLKGAIMRRMDFANAVALTMSSGTYTMPSNGYLQLNYTPSTAQTYQFKLNNKDIYISNVSLMPVSKDDVLGLNSAPFNGFFIPEKSN